MSYRKFLSCCFYIVSFLSLTRSQDALTFEETIENQDILPSDNRKPVENPKVCAENELYYPGDNLDDWICDCKPAYLYVPTSNKCFPAYEQGPCKDREYLVLPENAFVPVCQRNPCPKRNVRFEKKCVRLGSICRGDSRRRIEVDEVSLNVTCLQVPLQQAMALTTKKPTVVSRFGEEEQSTDVAPNCYKGCKRYQNKKCPGQENETKT